MKKLQVGLLALVAVFAFSAVLSASAIADKAETTLLAEWLKNGAAVVANLATTISGNLTLIHLNLAETACTGSFDGFAGANGVGSINEVLNAKGEKVREGLSGTGAILE